jgi:hypothetical protein
VQRPDLVGDLAERGEIDLAGVRGVAGQDDLRTMLLREIANAIHVQLLGLAVHLISDEVEPHAGDVHRRAVGEVPTVRELHPEDLVLRVVRPKEGSEDRHVRLRAGVRLDVRMLGAEQLLGPVDRELLRHIDELAAAVVAPPRIALGVLVRHRGTERREDGGARVVLGGDQP